MTEKEMFLSEPFVQEVISKKLLEQRVSIVQELEKMQRECDCADETGVYHLSEAIAYIKTL